MDELKRIALELLELYESAKEDVIYEYSTRTNEYMAELKCEVVEFRREIEEATE